MPRSQPGLAKGGATGERGPDTGSSRAWQSGSDPERRPGGQRRGALGQGGYNGITKHPVEGGLPRSAGDSEDRVRMEGQRCHEGKPQLWQPERTLGEAVSSSSLATFPRTGILQRGLRPGPRRAQGLSKVPPRLSAHGSGLWGLPQGVTHSSCRPGPRSPASGPPPRQWAPAALGHRGCPGHCLGTVAPADHSWPMGSRAGSSPQRLGRPGPGGWGS